MTPHLPDETLLNIFTYADSETLHRLCHASKTCCNIAQPLLFCTFDRRQVRTSLNHFQDNLPLFLRTLIERPRLTVHVRHITLNFWGYDGEGRSLASYGLTLTSMCQSALDNLPRPVPMPNLSLTLAPIYQSAVTKLPLSVSLKTRLMTSCGNGSEDAEVALLVILCQNLETLGFKIVEDGVETSLLMQLARETLQSVRPTQLVDSHHSHVLQCLRELHIGNWDAEWEAECDVDIAAISPLLVAPNLHSFTAEGLGCHGIHPRGLRPHYPTLKRVHLRYSSLSARGMAHILSSCPNLQTLSTQAGAGANRRPKSKFSGELEWYDIGRVLRKRGRTLQTLFLSPLDLCETYETEDLDRSEVIVPFGNLEPLDALKILTAPQSALLGRDNEFDDNYPNFAVPCLASILPKSLESLAITHCSEDTLVLDKAIIELIADPRYSKLKRVCIERKSGHLDFEDQNTAWDESIERWNDWYTGGLRMICRNRAVLPTTAT